MTDQLKKRKKTRAGHRAYVAKNVPEAEALVKEYTPERRERVMQLEASLEEQLKALEALDKEILTLLEDDESASEEDMGEEIERSCLLRSQLRTILALMNEQLGSQPGEADANVSDKGSENGSVNAASNSIRARLPKLEVRKFSGKVEEWQEFWDSFQSAIHTNGALADVDKFSYLKGLITGSAKAAIAGFALTSLNYASAIELLKKRYGKDTLIRRAHISELLNVQTVFSARDSSRLRTLLDAVETHYRGLEAMGVDEASYSDIVVPLLLRKIPEAVRLTITRGEAHTEWSMKELLEALEKEIELREEYQTTQNKERDDERPPERRKKWSGPPTANLFLTKQEEACAFCLGGHLHEDCRKIGDIKERKKCIIKFGRCFNCLKKGHRARECRIVIVCKKCKCKHHTAMCEERKRVESSKLEVGAVQATSGIETSHNNHVRTSSRVALQTAQALAKGRGEARIRILFDSASQKSFVTEQTVNNLGLDPIRKEWLAVSTFGKQSTEARLRNVVTVNLFPTGEGNVMRVEAFVVPDISRIQNEHVEVVKQDYPHLEDIWFSDVCRQGEELEIDLLIGADYLWIFQTGCTIRGGVDEPVAVETSLGWVLSGPLKFRSGSEEQIARVQCVVRERQPKTVDVARDVDKLWNLEALGITESNEVHEEFIDNISFNGSKYSVKLPWKEGHDDLPSNYTTSLARMKGQIKKLRKEPELLDEYDALIRQQIESGIIEKVAELERVEKLHYLPHLAVVRRDASTTKIRIVYDASAKDGYSKGTSLNDCLHVGPSLNPLLFDILTRFREKKIVLIGDIEKAFLNIGVDKADRDCLRFLWLSDVKDPNSEVSVYRFCRVVFGLNASPFLLNATIRYHLSKYKDEDPEFVRKMIEGFYVDDLVSGGNNVEETYQLYEHSKVRLAEGGFKLRKWKTNHKDLREKIAKDDTESLNETRITNEQESYAKSTLGTEVSERYEKVLGMSWDCERDTILFSFQHIISAAEKVKPTKRNVLSLLARIFDPLGIISPVLVCMKLLFQETCVAEIGWDDELQGEMRQKWDAWIMKLHETKLIEVDRCLYIDPSDDIYEYQLHGFGDASTKAYCAVVYLVCRTAKRTYARMICSKSRVAPLKTLTIPRLELMSAKLLAQLMHTVRKALGQEIQIRQVKYWLDSKRALCWIQNRGEWKQFVRHRVNEILKLTGKIEWQHCPGEQNPADIGSRGMGATELKENNHRWQGPQWLSEGEDAWPLVTSNAQTPESKEEEKKIATAMVVEAHDTNSIAGIIDLSGYSRQLRLIKVTALVRRFAHNCRANYLQVFRRGGKLTRDELRTAEEDWIKAAQTRVRKQEHFDKRVSSLGLVESEGILRCVGRLSNSDLEAEAREPVLLPNDHALTEMIIRECHEKVHHSGTRATLAEFRSKYWVIKGRQVVKKIINSCVRCLRFQGLPYNTPKVTPLPEFRVREAPPFSRVGVDFAGPLNVKGSNGYMRKVYIAIFSCCVSRALHLELVDDLSAHTFRRALRRFSARRGAPSLIVSDNAKTFKATAKALKKLQNHPAIRDDLDNTKTEWRFNLERAPWWGGFFERMVGSVKRCLRKTLGNAKLSRDELVTVLVEVEGTLNSRPLTYEYDEVNTEVLAPAHLIFGRRMKSIPDEPVEEEEEKEDNCSVRFRHLSLRLAHFWKRWRNEYLAGLREYHRDKFNGRKRIVSIGDVVTVYEDGVKRGGWKTAIVEELVVGKDEVVRGAKIRVITKGKPTHLTRPVQKLYPLEIRSATKQARVGVEKTEGKGVNVKVPEVAKNSRHNPRRTAAVASEWKTREMLKVDL